MIPIDEEAGKLRQVHEVKGKSSWRRNQHPSPQFNIHTYPSKIDTPVHAEVLGKTVCPKRCYIFMKKKKNDNHV